jgi:hypothetical protein
MIRNPAFYSFVNGIISKNFVYFLITNQVKSVVKIFRQIVDESPESVSFLTFLRMGLQWDSCYHVKVLVRKTNSPKVPLPELKNDSESGFFTRF